MTEAEMEIDICKKLKKNRGYIAVVDEVPILSRCVDICLVTKEFKIISIECKLNNWRSAIKQALDHQLFAEYSYICVPKKKVSEKILSELKGLNIGLFLYDKNSESPLIEVIKPDENTGHWEQHKISIRKMINKILDFRIFAI